MCLLCRGCAAVVCRSGVLRWCIVACVVARAVVHESTMSYQHCRINTHMYGVFPLLPSSSFSSSSLLQEEQAIRATVRRGSVEAAAVGACIEAEYKEKGWTEGKAAEGAAKEGGAKGGAKGEQKKATGGNQGGSSPKGQGKGKAGESKKGKGKKGAGKGKKGGNKRG